MRRGVADGLLEAFDPVRQRGTWADAHLIMVTPLAKDIRTGSRSTPTFAEAVALHEVLEAIDASARA